MDELPVFLYKYRNFEDPYMINIIKNSSLYFSQVKNFNDPFDLRLDFKQSYSKKELLSYIKKFAKEHNIINEEYVCAKAYWKNKEVFLKDQNNIAKDQINKIGILSLSTDDKNILMWSHYANNHTGLVFEFKAKESKSYFRIASPVKYQDNYNMLSYTSTGEKRSNELESLAMTKYIDWQYEQEYRILDLNSYGTRKFDKSDLTSIIFGLEATNENIEEIKTLCAENGFEHVKFKQMKRVHGKFELKIVDL
ncbi:DUF2971 domain-containing protein [Aliarcobacter butzleri]|uniref:DUF2971 domain-containing protein n=1 Tax=Aliarcobacter butzleri TaxID=28197 RepID=UPI003B21A828